MLHAPYLVVFRFYDFTILRESPGVVAPDEFVNAAELSVQFLKDLQLGVATGVAELPHARRQLLDQGFPWPGFCR